MRLSLTGRHVDVPPALRQLVTRRLERLERVFNDTLVSAQVVLFKERHLHQAELIIHARGDHQLQAIGGGATWAAAIGEAADKVSHQAAKLTGKWKTRKRRNGDRREVRAGATPEVRVANGTAATPPAPARPEREQVRVTRVAGVRKTRYAVKPMDLDDAVVRFRAGAEPFLLFWSIETERLALLFERPDGRLGLIDPES
ncbi:MAG: ribosome-associated translation inhibitor RaiA [Vicinamibacteraceae bacterium]